jgi:hypothetical protein
MQHCCFDLQQRLSSGSSEPDDSMRIRSIDHGTGDSIEGQALPVRPQGLMVV